MNRQDVNVLGSDELVHDAIRSANNLSHFGIIELWNRSPRLGKRDELLHGCDELTDCVVSMPNRI